MGDIYHVHPSTHRDRVDDFASHTGDIYMRKLESENGALKVWEIWATSPTTSHFNSFDDGTVVPNGTILHNIADNGLTYIKTAATTWVELGDLT